MENEGYASASQVASYLSSLGYSGKDSTYELIYGGGSEDPDQMCIRDSYYIKVKEKGRWRLAGDISLWNGMISVVLCKECQNRHIGRKDVYKRQGKSSLRSRV